METTMTATRQQIGDLVLRVETSFLDMPGLTLTAEQARHCFDIDVPTCRAVLDALTDARVLTKTPDGAYRRHFPHGRGRTAAAA
jgi:Fe2+ or Zn2+ uptake regulation protein